MSDQVDESEDQASQEMINPVISEESNSDKNSKKKSEALSEVITQTDRDGKSKTRAPSIQSSQTNPNDSEESSFFSYVCCCFYRQESKNKRSTELIHPSSSRNPINSTPNRLSISGQSKLLPPPSMINQTKKCLALDLDETLVHSSFQYVANADFVIPVTIEAVVHNVYVIKRPGVDEFMRRMGAIYEIVIYTASLSKYADPLLDKLDIHKVINYRLFRESCVYHEGHYVKDLSLLNREISQCIIVDNSPMSYIFHPDYAIDCSSFIDDPSDLEMWQIADFLEDLNRYDDVRGRTRVWKQWCYRNPNSSVPNR